MSILRNDSVALSILRIKGPYLGKPLYIKTPFSHVSPFHVRANCNVQWLQQMEGWFQALPSGDPTFLGSHQAHPLVPTSNATRHNGRVIAMGGTNYSGTRGLVYYVLALLVPFTWETSIHYRASVRYRLIQL